MKRLLLLFTLVFISGMGFLWAQDQPVAPSFIKTGVYHGLSAPLRDLPPLTPEEFHQLELKGEKKALNKTLKERYYPYAATALPNGPDPVWQEEMGKMQLSNRTTLLNFTGQTSPYIPPDCNGSVGPNHYMQTINTVYTIYDKNTGALLAGPTALNTLFSGVTGSNYNDGDPICLYDEQADRWLVAEFSISGTNDYMLIAVSATNDPTGAWHKYSFDVADTPDYEKFGIWRDGYYMGTNTYGGADMYVFERSQMLVGGTARAVGFDNPWRPTTIDGFMCVPPLDNDGAYAPEGSPGLFITINDDAIGGGDSDQLWIYELAVNWNDLQTSTFTRVQQLDVPAFDSNFGANWDNIKQPGTTRELDAIPMVIMNVPQYRNFGSYQTIVCCHTVDVDNTDHAGIRWYELRKTTGTWTVRQSGTYAPDAHSRWMGSVALNGNGQLGMGYSISSTSMYPSIRYCGQSSIAYASASGIMDIAEEIIQDGSSSQTLYNRWGDYHSISIDPTNDNTFWFTAQYGGSRQTKIAAFEFAPAPLTALFSASPTSLCAGGSVSFTDQSYGNPTTWSWSFPGGTPSSATSQNPTVGYNTPGTYSVTLTVGDGTTTNTRTETNLITVGTFTADFAAAPANAFISAPVAFTDLTNCNPTSWSWSFEGGTPSTSIAQNPTVTYAAAGTYSVTLTASNGASSDSETKTGYITITEQVLVYCESRGTTYSREWIGRVAFNSFSNSSGAAGYSDFTNMYIPMDPGSNVSVTLTPAFSGSSLKEIFRVWIDYNQDGDFADAGEQVFAPGPTKSGVSGNFTIPADVTGNTRMRVSMKYNTPPSYCEVFAYGEVEDYSVSFGTPLPPVADFTANLTTVGEGGTVQFTDLSTNNPASWSWTFDGGTPSSSDAQNPGITYSMAGVYTVSLTATNTSGSDTETKTNYITVVAVPGCASPVTPQNGASGVSIATNLQWSDVTDATGYILYLGTDNPPTNVVNGVNLGDVNIYNHANDLNYSSVYYWKIVPYNGNGNAVGCSEWSFTTEASPFGSTQLVYSDFESGLGEWADGGGDCARYTGGTYSSGGAASMDIQDNSGVGSSFFLTNGIDVHTPGYVQIDVEFEFIAVSMENGEDFWLQYYNGTTWQTVMSYAAGNHFTNGVFYAANVSILESSHVFPTGMKIRFMCDASDNNDDVYIDNIRISASMTASPNNYLVPLASPIGNPEQESGEPAEELTVHPNPVSDLLHVTLTSHDEADLYVYDVHGRVVQYQRMNNQSAQIDVSKLSNGVYVVYVITPKGTLSRNFVRK